MIEYSVVAGIIDTCASVVCVSGSLYVLCLICVIKGTIYLSFEARQVRGKGEGKTKRATCISDGPSSLVSLTCFVCMCACSSYCKKLSVLLRLPNKSHERCK